LSPGNNYLPPQPNHSLPPPPLPNRPGNSVDYRNPRNFGDGYDDRQVHRGYVASDGEWYEDERDRWRRPLPHPQIPTGGGGYDQGYYPQNDRPYPQGPGPGRGPPQHNSQYYDDRQFDYDGGGPMLGGGALPPPGPGYRDHEYRPMQQQPQPQHYDVRGGYASDHHRPNYASDTDFHDIRQRYDKEY
jgi:hypothetical protein